MSPSPKSIGRTMGSVKEEHKKRAFLAALFSGPVALVLVVLMAIGIARQPDPAEYDVPGEIGNVVSAQNWAQDYVLLWLGGSGAKGSGSSEGGDRSANEKALQDRTSAPANIELPQTPYAVQDIRATGQPSMNPLADGDIIWQVTVEAKVVAPGSSSVASHFYAVDMTQHGDSFTAQTLPREVNSMRTPFTVETLYTETADPASPLGTAAQAFASAYLAPDDATNFGTTISSNYLGRPLENSPYTTAELISVLYYGDIQLDAAEPGDSVNALLTVKASTSASTFSMTQLPVTMVMLDNRQWAVDDLNDAVDVGQTSTR